MKKSVAVTITYLIMESPWADGVRVTGNGADGVRVTGYMGPPLGTLRPFDLSTAADEAER